MTSKLSLQMNKLSSLLKNQITLKINYRNYCKASVLDEESLFISPKVQDLLTKITGFNIDKILKARPIKYVETPKYKLLTSQQLDEFQEKAKQKARRMLQMPPYMRAWKTEMAQDDVISDDKEISAYDRLESSFTFVDISPGIKLKERSVVIRELSGLLRNAIGEERDQLINIYYPRPGRMTYMPQMFQQEALERMLTEHRYEYVLTRACVQFEPDDPQFIRVTHRTYEHLITTGEFDQLRSTRFFGPMSFYYLLHHKIDHLLCDMLDKSLFEDAVNLVTLYHTIHPSSQSAHKCSSDTKPLDLLMTYIEEDGKEKIALKMSLEAYERKQMNDDQNTATN